MVVANGDCGLTAPDGQCSTLLLATTNGGVEHCGTCSTLWPTTAACAVEYFRVAVEKLALVWNGKHCYHNFVSTY